MDITVAPGQRLISARKSKGFDAPKPGLGIGFHGNVLARPIRWALRPPPFGSPPRRTKASGADSGAVPARPVASGAVAARPECGGDHDRHRHDLESGDGGRERPWR